MENQPLLSVIVSCYNLETYVDKCVSSIVAQTYSNLEILLIDDGSTDQTGSRCDAWQEKDERIRVIHKQNEGLSYTRKTGVENATAEYVTFVDNDDWIDKNMYADTMTALLSTNSDIAQCGYNEVYEDGFIICKSENIRGSFEVIGRKESVLLILEDIKWESYLWNKIFKKQLFNHIVFRKNLNLGEDFISHDLFHHASQSVYLNYAYYFYFQRSDSGVNIQSIKGEMKKISDFSDAYDERYFFVRQHPEYHDALPVIAYRTICLGIHLLRNMIAYPQYFNKNDFFIKSKQLRSIALPKTIQLQRFLKIEFYVLKISPIMYKLLRKLYIQIIGFTNKLKITNRKTSCFLSEDLWKSPDEYSDRILID